MDTKVWFAIVDDFRNFPLTTELDALLQDYELLRAQLHSFPYFIALTLTVILMYLIIPLR